MSPIAATYSSSAPTGRTTFRLAPARGVSTVFPFRVSAMVSAAGTMKPRPSDAATSSLAARAAGKVPIDAVYNDVRDPEGFTRECEQGRTLGFAGKTVIHPAQVEAANAAFGVTDAQAQAARELLDAWAQARQEGKSVTTHAGALVEQMHADEAGETLAFWQATQGKTT